MHLKTHLLIFLLTDNTTEIPKTDNQKAWYKRPIKVSQALAITQLLVP